MAEERIPAIFDTIFRLDGLFIICANAIMGRFRISNESGADVSGIGTDSNSKYDVSEVVRSFATAQPERLNDVRHF